ncbi:MAG TPA: DUF4349 domain-containing protein [Longimicrobium sp.]|jgi:hypothetical protein|uniref:DUF4349 domain-containing protein n=1 Tax=Longimicrobium sp. TaxID=2029185 RepID=UPI002ED9D702
MKRASILPILTLVLLSACGGGSESSAESSGGLQRESRDMAVEQEQAIVTMDVAVPAMEPPPPPVMGTASGVESGRAASPQAPAAQVQISAADTMMPPVPGAPSVSLNPMLIRTGTANIEVDSLEEGIAQLRALALRLGGLVGNTSISSGSDENRRASVELRIPSSSFDRAVSGLAPIGRVEQVNVTAEDVGEEYTDVTARVANARRLEVRLLDLLDRRTGRLEEVLNLERELARVREEIERYEGRLRYLRTRASVSVLTITLHEPGTALSRPGERPIRDAFGQAWRNLVDLIAGMIALSGVLIPLALLAYLAWRVFRWARRRERERDAAYRETLRRERERTPAPAPAPEEPAVRGKADY